MAWNLQDAQRGHIARMLSVRRPVNSAGSSTSMEATKLLIVDNFCSRILDRLFTLNQLQDLHGVTLLLSAEESRETVRDVAAVYFLRPSTRNIEIILNDISRGIYDSYHLNFSSFLPEGLLEQLINGSWRSADFVNKVFSNHLEFISIDASLFSLDQKFTFINLSEPSATMTDIAPIIKKIASGIFDVLCTLDIVPIIRCAKGGPPELVASALDALLRRRLSSRNTSELTTASFQRTLLCLFYRDADLAAGIKHDLRYCPLIHDTLGFDLNKVTLHGIAGELNNSDYFWIDNRWSPYHQVARELSILSMKLKHQGSQPLQEKFLVEKEADTVNIIPDMADFKKLVERHVRMTEELETHLMERHLYEYSHLEDTVLTKGSIDLAALFNLLSSNGTKLDKLRSAIFCLLSVDSMTHLELDTIEGKLREFDIDTSAFQYVRNTKHLNMPHTSDITGSPSTATTTTSILNRAKQSITSASKKFAAMLPQGRDIKLSTKVETLMDGKLSDELKSYLLFDPLAPAFGYGMRPVSSFKEAIVFMIGGGNFIEFQSFLEMTERSNPKKHIIYGTTDILNGNELLEQLTALGHKMDASQPSPPSRIR